MIKVFKFGGASVKDAAGIITLSNIVKLYSGNIIIVVSAIGKTTNALEELFEAYFYHRKMSDAFNRIKKVHFSILSDLFEEGDEIFDTIEQEFEKLSIQVRKISTNNYDLEYDQIVPYGEILSTKIISYYLNKTGVKNKWIDSRKRLKTDNCFRDASIDWESSLNQFNKEIDFSNDSLYITQGFIGGTTGNLSTTLGREGSDFSAAILANLLDAEDVTIWKDVPGILNADPKLFHNTENIPEISYQEAIELTYYGAKVIHPKTIKPLQNKSIPLYVKSFADLNTTGTVISNFDKTISYIPIIIVKDKQAYITISPKDLSFAIEGYLEKILAIFSELRIKINLIQNSAVDFSICADHEERKFKMLREELGDEFGIDISDKFKLITIRHYDEKTINEVIGESDIVVEQRNKENVHFIINGSNQI